MLSAEWASASRKAWERGATEPEGVEHKGSGRSEHHSRRRSMASESAERKKEELETQALRRSVAAVLAPGRSDPIGAPRRARKEAAG